MCLRFCRICGREWGYQFEQLLVFVVAELGELVLVVGIEVDVVFRLLGLFGLLGLVVVFVVGGLAHRI